MNNSYAQAGVNIDTADTVKKTISSLARAASRPEVLAGPGLFGGMFELKDFKHPVLVSSIDGVGTKIKIAIALDRYDTIGIDIVNHSVNDILTCGATPLFFLDYIAMGKLEPDKVIAVVKGLSKACQEVGCALIGGETAEMPGLYAKTDFDLAGCIVGGVEKEGIIDGRSIVPGDMIIGLPSSGLHTNGYSLARKVLGETREALSERYVELGRTVGEALLEPHRCYLKDLTPLLSVIKGIAHITGGGIQGNIPRILPPGLCARINTAAWEVPPLFRLIQAKGSVAEDEMYRVFNMGIGMAVITLAKNVSMIKSRLSDATCIGEVFKQECPERVVLFQED